MTIQYGDSDVSTNSLGKVTFITTTAVAFAISGFTAIPQGFHVLDFLSQNGSKGAAIEMMQSHDWESRLLGSESTGGKNLYGGDSANFVQLYAFALKLFGEQTDVPEEFNKLFRESFWDILA